MRIRALANWSLLTVYFALLGGVMVLSHVAKVPELGLVLPPTTAPRTQMHWDGLQLRRSCVEDRCEIFIGRDRGLELLASYPRTATVEITHDRLVHVWNADQARELLGQRARANAVSALLPALGVCTVLCAMLLAFVLFDSRVWKRGKRGSFVRVPNANAGYRAPAMILRWLVAEEPGMEPRLHATALTQAMAAGIMTVIALILALI